MADNNNLSILAKIQEKREAIAKLQQQETELTVAQSDELYKLETQLTKLTALQEKRYKKSIGFKQNELDIKKAYSSQLSELSSISSIYKNLSDVQKKTLTTSQDTQKTIQKSLSSDENKSKILTDVLDTVGTLQELQQKIAESGPDEVELQNSLRDSYKSQFNSIKEMLGAKVVVGELTKKEADYLEKIINSQKEGLGIAEKYAGISKETKTQIESQIEAYDSMKKIIRGTLDTIRMTLKTPQAMIVGASVAAGKFATAMAEVNRQTGMFMGSTALLSFVFDDAASTLSTMAKLSGDVNKATFGAQLNTNILATSLGIGGDEAATLVNSFGNLQGLSQDVGENMVSAVGNTARMNGVLPSQVMKDIANSTEEMAIYSKGTGENFASAAIQAAKLGVSIGTTTKMADSLLDFESSIEKELEASALLGRDINLTKARELAYADDIEGATKATLDAVGGIDEFNKMDIYQKKAVAEALGISVGELKQMVANQDNLNSSTGIAMTYLGKMNDAFRAIGDKFGGPIASGVTFFVGELLRAKMAAIAMNGGGAMDMLNPMNWIKKAPAAVEQSVAEKATETIQEKASEKAEGFVDDKIDSLASPEAVEGATESINKDKSMGDKLKDLSKGLKAMGDTKVLFGALNLIPTAIGLLTMVAGIPSLMAISAFGTGAGIGLTALGKGLKSFGNAGIAALKGIGLLALFGVALIPLTYALSLLAPLVESIGKAIGSMITAIAGGIATIIGSISQLMVQVLPLLNVEAAIGIFALAYAFTSLAAALGMFAIAGLLAIPAMAAVGGFAAVTGNELAGQILGGGNDSGVVDELKALRNDLTSGKIAVYIDGRKVTNTVATTAGKDPTTTR